MAPKKKKGSGGGKKKKKGSGKGKLANMTEEEKMLYLEQQRLAEEEFKKQREEFLSAYLQGKINHEEKFSNLNLYKLNHQWRNIMREAKAKELKKEIEILSQTFERVVDRKESVLKSLVKDIEEADEQFLMAVRSHLQNVDKLIAIQQQRLERLTMEYHEELQMIKEEFDNEENYMTEQHQNQMQDLQDILFGFQESYMEKEVEARADFQSTCDEIKNKNNEEKHALRVILEGKVEEYWQQFNQAKRSYKEATSERKNNFEKLKEKDESAAKEIEMQMRKLYKISSEISTVKSKMAQNTRHYDERNKMLKDEREKMVKLHQQLKGQMNKIRDLQRQKLTKMTLESNGALKELKRLLEKSAKILKLGEMVRKLETEEEKVLPVPASSLTKEEQDDVDAALKEESNEGLAEAMKKYQSLEVFWRRFNKVQLDKLALDKEKSVLTSENQQLRSLLKQYLDGVSVNDEILSNVNPLMIVNGRTNVNINPSPLDPRVRPAANILVEGNTEVRNKKLMN